MVCPRRLLGLLGLGRTCRALRLVSNFLLCFGSVSFLSLSLLYSPRRSLGIEWMGKKQVVRADWRWQEGRLEINVPSLAHNNVVERSVPPSEACETDLENHFVLRGRVYEC